MDNIVLLCYSSFFGVIFKLNLFLELKESKLLKYE
jgi:hypothetical protein